MPLRKSEILDRVLPHLSCGLITEYLSQHGIALSKAAAQPDGDVSAAITLAVLQAPKAKRDIVIGELEELDESIDDGFIQTLVTTGRLMKIFAPLELVFPKLCSNHERALWTLVNHRDLRRKFANGRNRPS